MELTTVVMINLNQTLNPHLEENTSTSFEFTSNNFTEVLTNFNNDSASGRPGGGGSGSWPKFVPPEPPEIPVPMRVVGFMLCFAISFSGLIGNLMLLLSVIRFRSLQTTANYLVASMATVDLAHIVGFIWIDLMVYALGRWPFNSDQMCFYQLGFLIYGGMLVLFHIFFITFYRYLSIVSPKAHSFMAKLPMLCLSFAIIFITPIFVMVFTSLRGIKKGLSYGAVFQHDPHLMSCRSLSSRPRPPSLDWLAIPLFFGSLIICLYLHIYYVYKSNQNRVAGHGSGGAGGEAGGGAGASRNLKGALRLVQIMLLIVGIYLLTQLIPAVMYINIDKKYPWGVAFIPVIIRWVRISVNWLLYGALNKNFRNAYKKVYKRFSGAGNPDITLNNVSQAPHSKYPGTNVNNVDWKPKETQKPFHFLG